MSHPVVMFDYMNTTSHTHPTASDNQVVAAPLSHALVGVQQALPYDDERDLPITYTLTPAAQQLFEPGSRPQLRAVPPLADDDDDRDPRRAQVKAMYRGGLSPDAIATQLEIDPLLVRGWLELAPVVRRSTVGATATPAPQALKTITEADVFRASEQLQHAPRFAFAVGVLAATAEIEPSSVTFTFTDPALAKTVLSLLRTHTPFASAQLHVVLRLARRSHGDVVRNRWAETLDLDPTQIRTVRSRNDRTDEALLRVVDPTVAALCTLWCDMALRDRKPSLDVAF